MLKSEKPLHVHTQLLESQVLSKKTGMRIFLKLENAQPTATFKIRGVGNFCQKAKNGGTKHVVCSSGGNAGLAMAYAARLLNMEATVVVPSHCPQYMRERIEVEGANVQVFGDVWDEANKKAVDICKSPDCTIVPPFDHPHIWEGHTSIVEELAEDMPCGHKPDVIVASVGGGGLLVGVLHGLLKVGWGDVPVIAMETEGSNCFNEAIKSNKIVTLPGITSIARCLGALTVCEELFRIRNDFTIHSRTVSDREAVDALLKFAEDHKILVEPACSASLAVLYSDIIQQLAKPGDSVVVIVCGGAGISLAEINSWKQRFHL